MTVRVKTDAQAQRIYRGPATFDAAKWHHAPGDLIVYTDGSGTQGHLPAGSAAVLFDYDAIVLEARRHHPMGTNNHAEVDAILLACEMTHCREFFDRELVVRSDSLYALTSIAKEWAPQPGYPNRELVIRVRGMLSERNFRLEHVRGHSGHPGNNRADKLAGEARLQVGVSAPAPTLIPVQWR